MPLAIEEHREHGVIRLVLIGELGINTATPLADRCLSLRQAGAAVRVDLSQVEFMDGFGAGVLRAAISHAQLQRCGFELEPHTCPRVAALLRLAGLQVLAPDGLKETPTSRS
jgi:anti-anti-sigma factor